MMRENDFHIMIDWFLKNLVKQHVQQSKRAFHWSISFSYKDKASYISYFKAKTDETYKRISTKDLQIESNDAVSDDTKTDLCFSFSSSC